MYAFAKVIIERPGVRALPVSALMHLGDKTILQVGEKTVCWIYEDGRAKRIEVRDRGQRRRSGSKSPIAARAGSGATSTGDEPWTPIDGTEQVILGNLSTLAEGSSVKVAETPDATQVAAEAPAAGPARPNPS